MLERLTHQIVPSAAVATTTFLGSPSGMMTQRLTALTPMDVALAALMDGLVPVIPKDLLLADAVGHVAVGAPALGHALPLHATAATDGWACCANDLVGASSYSPVLLMRSPQWVEAGERLPAESDCIVEADLLQKSGSMFQVMAEAVPGQGVRRVGDDIAAGASIVSEGVRISPMHVLAARAAAYHSLQVRLPRLQIVNVFSTKGEPISSQLIAGLAVSDGADVVSVASTARDAASIAEALDTKACDLIVLVGGTGAGQTDAAVAALAARGQILAHGLALQPGRTSAIGKIGRVPVIALPGLPDQALAGWLTLVQPVLDRLSARAPRQATVRRLARKISSAIGVTEIALLKKMNEDWMPLAVGTLSIDAIAHADAWLAVPGDSEGYTAGTLSPAFSLREAL